MGGVEGHATMTMVNARHWMLAQMRAGHLIQKATDNRPSGVAGIKPGPIPQTALMCREGETMETNDYWLIRGNYAEKKAALQEMEKEHIEAIVLDRHYNNFLSSYADYKDDDEDPHGAGKRVPYIGWFWRHINFANKRIPIGNCGDFIGFMANNKWDHPERNLTEEEADRVIAIIDEAIVESQKGGVLDNILSATHAKLDELWDYMQTLSVED